MAGQGVAILGIFVADLAFRSSRMPAVGETIAGSGFALGPGGKGSNQSVAAARAGAAVRFVSKLGRDAFGDIAIATWEKEGVTPYVARSETPTGAAFVYVNEVNGENAIIVVPGAAGSLSPADVEDAREAIASAAVFVTQFEQPQDAALRGLEIARDAGVTTIFNPAPAIAVDDAFYGLSSFVVPNETEAAALTGFALQSLDDARRAGDWFLARGAGTALITLGERGVLVHGRDGSTHVPAFAAGPVVETAGAGDAFVGAFAAALSEGLDPLESARFGSAAAGISVTRPGTAPSMPHLAEVQALLARG
ncbi:ribokinase [Aureimonas flava]|uniref:Ribokinase n=1 Tax=Aureimonas flava TaxID=2320271 RepID=A0A3A1WIT2_9HYPH|nr:ribokinase [Aureimonas flava]RIX98211.1 ribokinase [Aureimonas flava]